ncbi:MAG: hypothetical protein Q9M36_14640 [Sulfurovum sp.]|nr:hypothetical protein [Sulfurovum sp.]
MKNNNIVLISLLALVFMFNGCGSSDNTSGGNNSQNNLVTLFLVDEEGFSYGNIPYFCDSMSAWETTPANGEFTFYPPDNCEFDFSRLEGNYDNDTRFDDIVRIVDYADEGKNGIPYQCVSFGASTTYGDGRFDYDIDDACIFYL